MDIEINFDKYVLIPFLTSNKNETLTCEKISKMTYKDFRNVIFQGELLKFYIIIKSPNSIPNLKEYFEQFYFKIEFEKSEGTKEFDNKSLLSNQNENEYEKTLNDLFTINTEKLNDKNYEYEKISSREFNESENLMIYEIYKQIIVPKDLLNSTIIMRVNILKKNDISFSQEMDALDYYQNGYFSTVQKFKSLFTIFKLVNIIRPLKIEIMKQYDVLLDTSLLQIKISNITSYYFFYDGYLIKCNFLSKENIPQYKSIGVDISIQEIQILKDETTINEDLTNNLSKIKQIFMKNGKVTLNNIQFSLFNVNLPIIIHPGEDYNLTIKVIKSAFLSEKEENSENKLNFDLKDSSTKNSEITLTTPSENNLTKKNYLETQIQNSNYSNQINPYEQVIKTEANINFQRNLLSKNLKDEQSIRTMTSVSSSQFENQTLNDKEIDKGENFQVSFTTPIILNIACSIFYENLFMCLPIKWINEINRFLKVEISFPEEIFLHEYFEISLKIRNISSNKMNLLIEINDSFEDMKDEENKSELNYKNIENIPSIISQTKLQSFGLFNCNEDKIFNLRFLALKKGFNQLPNFSIIDYDSKRKFQIEQTNKIFVKEKEKL
jgi:hypothetical protein